MAQDIYGDIWVGTEDLGLFRCHKDNSGEHWLNFTTKDGLGDNNGYAICCDKQGRIWVGHLNHGVSVWNGDQWKNYDVPDGPIGERVFDIACCPTDGSVWMATSAGLTRYCPKDDSWRHYTRADGLPEDQANSIALDASGNLYVGTQCHGIAIAQARNDYKDWRTVRAPDRFGPGSCSPVPLEATGTGLPTNLINRVMVGKDNTIWAATTAGLAWSADGGQSWQYIRGKDYMGKVQGLMGGQPEGWKVASDEAVATLLPEDCLTCLAQDPSGAIWLGTRLTGFVAIDPKTRKRISGDEKPTGLKNNYVSAILPMPDGRPFVGGYLGGLIRVEGAVSVNTSTAVRYKSAPTTVPALPSPIKPPTLDELNRILATLSQATEKQDPGLITPLADDWRTQGDWLGRYGRYWACCCAITSPSDYLWGAGWDKVDYCARIGPNCKYGDSMRYYITWLATDNPKCLEMPPTYLDSRVSGGCNTRTNCRREDEWNDYDSTGYPLANDGPDVYCTLTIPAGTYTLSLYDFNKDGHDGLNSIRDLPISIRSHREEKLYDISTFEQQPELVRGRIRDFWGGVWKRYMVNGPTTLTIRLKRNWAFCTILSGVMLDLQDECPAPYFSNVQEWTKEHTAKCDKARKFLSTLTSGVGPAPDLAKAADSLFDSLEMIRLANPSWWAINSRPHYQRLLAYYQDAGAEKVGGNPALLKPTATCYYYLNQYGRWENCQRLLDLTPARDIEQGIRWDGSNSCKGKGYQFVKDFVERRF
jgi:hypothetical protein